VNFVRVETEDGIALVTLQRGKVNAITGTVVDELRGCFEKLETDPDTRAVLFTGSGKFFSFGFDIPEFLSYGKEAFTEYLTNFTDLYTYMFQFPKPLVAALNGHTIAGGCMLALACDSRIMVEGKGKISLNEIAFGSSVFAGSTEMLRFAAGSANATAVLYSGAMLTAGEAMKFGLVNAVSTEDDLMQRAKGVAADMASKRPRAFASIKRLLRKSIAEEMVKREAESIREFVDIWYSEPTWSNVQEIKIR